MQPALVFGGKAPKMWRLALIRSPNVQYHLAKSWPVSYRPPTGEETNHDPELRRHGGWPVSYRPWRGEGAIGVRTTGFGGRRGGSGPISLGPQHRRIVLGGKVVL